MYAPGLLGSPVITASFIPGLNPGGVKSCQPRPLLAIIRMSGGPIGTAIAVAPGIGNGVMLTGASTAIRHCPFILCHTVV